MNDDVLLVTVPDAMAALSLSRCQVYDLIRSRRLVSVKVGRSRRVPAAALRDYVAQLIEEQE